MLCWPVYFVGGFFISLLLLDIYQYSWNILPYHAGLGICFTGLYYLFCVFFGNDISMAVLFVPTVFILMFFLASWLFYKNIQAHGCCMTCNTKPSSQTGSEGTGSEGTGSAGTASPTYTNPFTDFFDWVFKEEPPKRKCPKAT
jgi:hypothetical protein